MVDTDADPIFKLLHEMADAGHSDLHLVPGYPPTYRSHGALQAADQGILDGSAVRAMLEAAL